MGIKDKITDIIEERINFFANYQFNLIKQSAQNTSGVSNGRIEKIDPKTGIANFRSTDGSLLTGVQINSPTAAIGKPGYVLGGTNGVFKSN